MNWGIPYPPQVVVRDAAIRDFTKRQLWDELWRQIRHDIASWLRRKFEWQ